MRLLAILVVALSGVIAGPAVAAGYPERNITIIVPFPPGGSSDNVARLVGAKMGERLKQTVIVDNRGGANGAIGAMAAKNSKADGYTILVGSIGTFAINPALFKDLKYDPLKDFDLLTIHVWNPNILVVPANFPVNSVAEFVAYLKANPDKVTFASSGIGSSDHLTAVLFWQMTGTSGVHVPYKGAGPAINDLMGGHANASFQNLGSVAQQIRSGNLKPLAVTGTRRDPGFPDIPTMAEAGVQGVEVYSFQASVAPKGLPADVRALLEAELIAATKAPDTKAKLEQMGYEVIANTSAEFNAYLEKEIPRWRKVIETGKITAVP